MFSFILATRYHAATHMTAVIALQDSYSVRMSPIAKQIQAALLFGSLIHQGTISLQQQFA